MFRNVKDLLQRTYSEWSAHNAPRLGAALAYYALLSMSPLLILLVAICGLVFHGNAAERDLLAQTQSLMGPAAAKTFSQLLSNVHHSGAGVVATVVAFVTLFLGASGVFMELKSALNAIWDVPPRAASGIWQFLSQRLFAFAMVVGLGIFLLSSVAASAALTIAEKYASGWLGSSAVITAEVLNFCAPLATLTVLFGAVFRFVPSRPVPWRQGLAGAFVTALLFMLGKSLLALYLSTAAVGSAYGAAGSLVAFVVWVYYSAQIFFFGATFTKLCAGSRLNPYYRKKPQVESAVT